MEVVGETCCEPFGCAVSDAVDVHGRGILSGPSEGCRAADINALRADAQGCLRCERAEERRAEPGEPVSFCSHRRQQWPPRTAPKESTSSCCDSNHPPERESSHLPGVRIRRTGYRVKSLETSHCLLQNQSCLVLLPAPIRLRVGAAKGQLGLLATIGQHGPNLFRRRREWTDRRCDGHRATRMENHCVHHRG